MKKINNYFIFFVFFLLASLLFLDLIYLFNAINDLEQIPPKMFISILVVVDIFFLLSFLATIFSSKKFTFIALVVYSLLHIMLIAYSPASFGALHSLLHIFLFYIVLIQHVIFSGKNHDVVTKK